MTISKRWWTLAAAAALTGCGKPGSDGTSVSGLVTVDGQPAYGALITFLPDGGTQALPASAGTGPDGKYVLRGPQGQTAVAAGTYKVVVSRPLRKDGSPPPPDLPPIESDAVETLPPTYSDPEKTTLRATVEPSGTGTVDLALMTGKKK